MHARSAQPGLGRRRVRNLGPQRRPGTGGAHELQGTAKRLDAIRQPSEARAAARVGAADPVVRHLDDYVRIGQGDPDVHRGCLAYFATLVSASAIR